MFFNWRYNTFENIFYPVNLEEYHTVQLAPDWNSYGFQLREVPLLENPSSIEIREDVTGGSLWTEVPRSQPPSQGQYRVDYGTVNFFGTGRIEFNPADNGKKFQVNYKGLGTIVKNNYYLDQYSLISTNLRVYGDLYTILDTPAIINQFDPALDKEYFLSNTPYIDYVNEGKDNKKSIKFNADGSDHYSEYRINDLDTFIRIPEYYNWNFLLRLKKNAEYTAGNFYIIAECFDKDYISLGTVQTGVFYSSIEETEKWFYRVIDDFLENTIYIKLFIGISSASTAGSVSCDWFFGGEVQVPSEILSEIMIGSSVGHWKPEGKRGKTDIFWHKTIQTIIVPADGTRNNYLLTNSGRFDKSIVAIIITPVLLVEDFLRQFEGDSDPAISMNFESRFMALDLSGPPVDLTLINTIIMPISYFSGKQAGIRIAIGDAGGSPLVGSRDLYVRGFILK